MAIKRDVHPLLKRAKDIDTMVPYWDQSDAIIEGEEAVKKVESFLPKFPDEDGEDYAFRLSVGKFTNIYRDVLEGLATKPFQNEVTLIKGEGGKEIPTNVSEFIENVDGAGNNLNTFAALTFFNAINSALDWIFVDYPNTDPNLKLSIAEAKAKNLRPFWTRVLARNVLEVRTTMIGSEELISYMRIFEPSTEADKNDHVRVFSRDANGVVTWELWMNVPDAKEVEKSMVKVQDGKLSINVIPLIPVITGRKDGRSWKFYPAMRDAADLQIKLYQNESALEYTKVLACYPMLAANGMKPEKEADGKTNKKLAIGPGRVLYGVPDGAGNHGEWKFIEPNANSMEFMQKNIDKTKQDLRELGRQPLTALSTQLTTVTTSIAAGKAKSAVTAWALMLKDALENALKITMLYLGNSGYEPQVNVYTGFDNITDEGKDLEALDKARARGDLSQETFLDELKRRKVLSPEFNYKDELKKILSEVPTDMVDDPIPENDAPSNQTT